MALAAEEEGEFGIREELGGEGVVRREEGEEEEEEEVNRLFRTFVARETIPVQPQITDLTASHVTHPGLKQLSGKM